MKHITLAALFAASSLFAATNEQVVGFIKQQVPEGITVNVEERQSVDGAKGYDRVLINISDGTQSQQTTLFVKDGLMFPDIIDLATGASVKQSIEQAQIEQKLGAIYKQEDKSNIIAIGNDKNKETLVVFSDPECPYCRAELENIEARLEGANLRLILTSVHDKTALEKSYLIYQEVAKAKNDAEKIAILRKYFDEELKAVETDISDEEIASMEKLRRKYLQGGLKGVPFLVNEDALLK
jgi:thiol:disulfide interchange protein DsbC